MDDLNTPGIAPDFARRAKIDDQVEKRLLLFSFLIHPQIGYSMGVLTRPQVGDFGVAIGGWGL
jgi:hypothetical protein